MDDDNLRAELRSAIPEPPDASGWADQARLRHGRRIRLAMTGAVTVLVLAVIGAFLWPSVNGGVRNAVPAASPSSAGSSRPATTTPAPSNDVEPAECRGLKQSAGPLPPAAQRLWLCRADAFTAEVLNPLLTVLDGDRANAVLATLAAQKPHDAPFCSADGGPAFWLVAETDTAVPVVMNLELFGCEEAGTSDDIRTGADAVLKEFLTQVTRQRELTEPTEPAWTPATLCRDIGSSPRSVIPTTVDAMTTVTLCRYSAKGKGDSMARLSSDDTHAVLADVAAHSADAQQLPCPTPPSTRSDRWRLALSNSYGDVILLERSCAGRFLYNGGGGRERQWTPSATTARLLARIATP